MSQLSRRWKNAATRCGAERTTAIEAVGSLIEASERIREEFDALYARYGQVRGRVRILVYLFSSDTGEGVQPTELADLLRISRATVTGLVDALEGQGLVERNISADDRRSIRVRLTDAGRSLVEALMPKIVEMSERAWVELG